MECTIKEIITSKPALEGAGVRLNRVFSYHNIPQFDPFLLLDDFGSNNPQDYIKGFPWHPHRGIETVTYMLNGTVQHEDSLGNKGTITSGDIQWMTAGSGIIHQEMPQHHPGRLQGLQLWVNLPAHKKMMQPRYQETLKNSIPQIQYHDATIKIIAGTINNHHGPVKDLIVDVTCLDISLPKNKTFTYNTPIDHTVLIYILNGTAAYLQTKNIHLQQCVLFNNGNHVSIQAQTPLHFLFITGKPIHEPIAWGGPIVMNTQQELNQAYQELNQGTFIKPYNTITPATN